MPEDSVRRTDAVPLLGGFGGHHGEAAPKARPEGEREEAPPPFRARDEVMLRADVVAAMRLLRERVFARTRGHLGLGDEPVQVFAEIFEGEAVPTFVSRLLSDQNLLIAKAGADGERRQVERAEAFGQGLVETRELLTDAASDVLALLDDIEVEFRRRMEPAE